MTLCTITGSLKDSANVDINDVRPMFVQLNKKAAVRTDADDLYIFLDGTRQTATSNLGSNSFFGSDEVLVLASDITGADCLTGSLAEVRVSKGTDRGWTGTTITVPTVPYRV